MIRLLAIALLIGVLASIITYWWGGSPTSQWGRSGAINVADIRQLAELRLIRAEVSTRQLKWKGEQGRGPWRFLSTIIPVQVHIGIRADDVIITRDGDTIIVKIPPARVLKATANYQGMQEWLKGGNAYANENWTTELAIAAEKEAADKALNLYGPIAQQNLRRTIAAFLADLGVPPTQTRIIE